MKTYTASWTDERGDRRKLTVHSLRAAEMLLTNLTSAGYDAHLTSNTRTFNTIIIKLDGQPVKL